MERIFVGVYVSREAAVLAGKPKFGWIYLEIDPSQLTDAQRQILVQMPLEKKQTDPSQKFYNLNVDEACANPNSQAFYGHRLKDIHTTQPVLTSLTQKDFVEFLAFVAEVSEKFAQLRKDRIKDWLANGDLSNFEQKFREDPEFAEAVRKKEDELRQKRAEHLEAIKQKEQEQDELNRKRRAERVAQEASLKRKKDDQLAKWVLRFGTDTEKKMHERGVLAPGSVLARVRDELFKEFADLERFKQIKDSDVIALVDYTSDGGDEIEYTARDFDDTFEPEQFELLERIEQAASRIKADHVKVTPKCHFGGYASRTDWDVKQLTAHVSVMINGWELSREFALSSIVVLS